MSKQAVGKLRSETLISIHTDLTVALWEGKRNENLFLPSIPLCVKKIELIDKNIKDPKYSIIANIYKTTICDIISTLDEFIGAERDKLDALFASIPKRIKIKEPESLEPRIINFYSDSPLSYQLIYILVSLDELATQALNAKHVGLISQERLTSLLKSTSKKFRRTLSVINLYKPFDTVESAMDFFASKGMKLKPTL